jgi:hypothetical protein
VLKVIEVIRSVDQEPFAFVCGDARAESSRCCIERRSGANYFLYTTLHV